MQKVQSEKKLNGWAKSGQVTVFMLLLFMVVFSVLLAQYHSAIFYACKADAERAARLSTESFLAAYQRPLRDRYQILSIDGGGGQDVFQQESLEKQLLHVYENNMQSVITQMNVGGLTMDEPIFTMLVDGDWDFFLREITLNRKDALLEGGIEFIMGQWKDNNEIASGDLYQKRMEAQDQMVEDAVQREEDSIKEEQQQVTDPRNFVMEIWNQGILKAACPADFVVSERECLMSDVSFPEAGNRVQAKVDFKDDVNIQSLFGKLDDILDPDQMTQNLAQEAAVQMYIKDVFRNAVDILDTPEEWGSVLDYEMEYIIAGNETDSENLKTVLWKILAIRCVMNLSFILMSPEMDMQVAGTAAAVSTVVLLPQLTDVVAFLMKCAWAFAEALSDCRTLLKGGKIPLVKTSQTWHLSWNQMIQLNSAILDSNPGQDGLDYSSYLSILLLLTKQDIKCRRMTHLMEKNIRLIPEYSGFQMKNCIYGVQTVFHCNMGIYGDHEIQTALSY